MVNGMWEEVSQDTSKPGPYKHLEQTVSSFFPGHSNLAGYKMEEGHQLHFGL